MQNEKMINKTSILPVLILLSMVVGCRLLGQFKPNFFEGNDSYSAAEAIKSKIGVAFKVQKIEITENKFRMVVESPTNPRNTDEYTYIGVAAVGPNPLEFDPYDAKEIDRLPFDQIDFTVIPQMIQNALDKTQLEGGKVTEIMFFTRVGNKFGWDVQVKGTRERASVRADLQGNIVSTNLSQTSKAADYKILNAAELENASNAIKAKFGKDAQISDLRIDEKYLSFKVKNPQKADEVLVYTFGIDGLKKVLPVGIPNSMTGEEIPFSQINFVDILNLSQKAKEKLEMPNGQVDSIAFVQYPIFSNGKVSSEWRWVVSIIQGTSKGEVKYDSKLVEIADDKK